MTEGISILSGDEWLQFSESAHLLSFGEIRPCEIERCDFALLYSAEGKPHAYITCHEMDSETVYIQYGGVLRRETMKIFSYRGYLKMLETLAMKFKRATTYIENTNIKMLKPAMKAGFIITGVRVFKGMILLDHLLEFGELNA